MAADEVARSLTTKTDAPKNAPDTDGAAVDA